MRIVSGKVTGISSGNRNLTISEQGKEVTVRITDQTHIRRRLDDSVSPPYEQIPLSEVKVGDDATAAVQDGTNCAAMLQLKMASQSRQKRIGLSERGGSEPATLGDLRDAGFFSAPSDTGGPSRRETFNVACSELDQLVGRRMEQNPQMNRETAFRLVLTEDARFHPSRRKGNG